MWFCTVAKKIKGVVTYITTSSQDYYECEQQLRTYCGWRANREAYYHTYQKIDGHPLIGFSYMGREDFYGYISHDIIADPTPPEQP